MQSALLFPVYLLHQRKRNKYKIYSVFRKIFRYVKNAILISTDISKSTLLYLKTHASGFIIADSYIIDQIYRFRLSNHMESNKLCTYL